VIKGGKLCAHGYKGVCGKQERHGNQLHSRSGVGPSTLRGDGDISDIQFLRNRKIASLLGKGGCGGCGDLEFARGGSKVHVE